MYEEKILLLLLSFWVINNLYL